jgi:hypothetical protein
MLDCRLTDVEAKLKSAETEASKTQKASKTAREKFNDLKKKRYALSITFLSRLTKHAIGVTYSTKLTFTSPSGSTRCTRISPRAKLPPWVVWPT